MGKFLYIYVNRQNNNYKTRKCSVFIFNIIIVYLYLIAYVLCQNHNKARRRIQRTPLKRLEGQAILV